MSLTEKEKNRLLSFLGYGNPEARIWFLGMEEKLPKDAVPADEFENRAKFEPTMDLYDAQDRLGRPVGSRKISQVWQWMAKIARRINDPASDWTDKRRAKDYICSEKKLGAKNSDVFLIEFSPIPASTRDKRGWSKFHRSNFGNRKEYERHMRPSRIKSIGRLLNQNKRLKYLFAYGKCNWEDYLDILDLEKTELETISGTRDRIRIKKSKEKTIILLPFLGNGRLSTKDVRRLFEELEPAGKLRPAHN